MRPWHAAQSEIRVLLDQLSNATADCSHTRAPWGFSNEPMLTSTKNVSGGVACASIELEVRSNPSESRLKRNPVNSHGSKCGERPTSVL